LIEKFVEAGGAGKPRYAEVTVCWAADDATARRTALEWWPIAALNGSLYAELALPSHFEGATSTVREEDLTPTVVCGPDPEQHLAKIREYLDAGFDHVWIHQVGPDQDGFFRFYEREVLPRIVAAS
jgi:coenzyme F420-dependent glucose-6-phosphate dehydrogenase